MAEGRMDLFQVLFSMRQRMVPVFHMNSSSLMCLNWNQKITVWTPKAIAGATQLHTDLTEVSGLVHVHTLVGLHSISSTRETGERPRI
jgi:hypothetical protein